MRIFGPYKKTSRKASMQLSINAIVILVMAMAVLGLGLGLVKGIRQKSNEFMDFEVNLDQEADATTPIANFKDTITMTIGKEEKYGISFYNKGYSCQTTGNEAKVKISCATGLATDPAEILMNITQRPTEALTGEATTLKFRATPVKHASTPNQGFESGKSYFCDLIVMCGSTEAAKFPFDLEI